ncbi:hypothetical protein HDE78_003075 [Rhodanobacter sp. K2T2]|uniref:hypothetical protein n=1 Tax=Rhodanobacter sp. K2T2 TaxID=2723085 RepID=UPI0015C8FE84|nr:hypothetical protein [Rhodanobacter sp. K2T2]NYE30107.1 hypothetical protein [Rhodanobacter sp. K2T2]
MLDQIDDMAFRVVVAISEFIQNSDRGMLDNFSKEDDALEKRGAVDLTPVGALPEVGSKFRSTASSAARTTHHRR